MRVKPWEELEITDDFLFGKVMQNPEICRQTLEAILDIEISRVDYLEGQKTLDITADGKSVRLDIYLKDSENVVYNIEMQPMKRGHLPKRSRYYQALMDLNLIEKGAGYSELNQSYVIFICGFDLFGRNRCIYTFENRCREETYLSLGDETIKIFLNSKGNTASVNANLGAFLAYINHEENVNNDFVDALDKEVKKVMENKEWRMEYVKLHLRDQENREEGEAIKLISLVRKKAEKNVSAEDAANMLEDTTQNIQRIMDVIREHPELNDEQVYYKMIELYL